MKKILFALLTLGLFVGVSKADDFRPSPTGNLGGNADYGGYKVSTHAFGHGAAAAGINYSTASFSGPGVLAAVVFSTGNVFDNDYVEVWDSTAVTFANNNTLIGRFYNQATYSVSGSSTAAGFAGPVRPIQFNSGLLLRPSSNRYNMINLLFYKK